MDSDEEEQDKMEKVLLIAYTEPDGHLAKATSELIGCARALVADLEGATWSIGLIGNDVQDAADRMAGCGAERIWAVRGESFGQPRYATDAAAAEALARATEATILLAAAGSRASRALPGIAPRLGGRCDAHMTALEVADGQILATRWYYRQRMVARMKRSQRPWILTMEPGCAEPFSPEPGKVQVETIDVEVPEQLTRTKVVGIQTPPASQQTIRPDADLLFVAGAGWTKKQQDGQPHVPEAERLIVSFLNHSKASLGGSKSMVDLSSEGQETLSIMTHLNQIGQTGSTPRHPKGLATCCHGEEPHVVGWRFINERRAINNDPNCGWAHGKADVLYVADAFRVMENVNQLLGR